MTLTSKLQRVTDADGILCLLEMSAPSFGATLRMANDTRDWVSNGETYVGFPFRFKMPDDVAGQVSRTQIEIDNIGRGMTADLEGLPPNTIITAVLIIADKADPDAIYREIPLPVTRVSVNPTVATADCGVDYVMRGAASRLRYTPFVTPGIF